VLSLAFGASEIETPMHGMFQLVVALVIGVGGLLLWIGLGGEESRVVRRWAVGFLGAAVVVTFAYGLLAPFRDSRTGDLVEDLAHVWNLLRILVRPYAEILIVTVGLFAWIVGAREDRGVESVFE
jgi:hypothetical protein